MGTFTEGVLESTTPLDSGQDWLNYNTALAAMFEQVWSIVSDQGSPDQPATYTSGWSVLLDPTQAPAWALPYTAAFVGVQVPDGMSESAARALILAQPGFQRGTPGAIVAAAQRYLTGTQYCQLVERMGSNGADAYSFQLIVKPEELSHGQTWEQSTTPWDLEPGTWDGTDSTVSLTNAVNAVKPAGVVWQLVSTDGHTWSEATKAWSAETITWSQADSNPV